MTEPAPTQPRRLERLAPAAIFAFAALVRLFALTVQVDAPVFDKYPAAARLVASGALHGARVLDFSPLYLDLHRLARWLGVTHADTLRVLQCLLGAALCVLVYELGRRILDARAGVVAGIAASLSLDLVVYSHVFDAETVLVLLVLLALYALHRTAEGAAPLWPALAGLTSALAIATRPAAWLFLPVFALLAWRLVPVAQRRGALAASLLAFALVLGAFALRAQAFSEGSAEVMSPWQVVHGGNNPWADGYYTPLRLAKDLEEERPAAGPDFAHQIHRALGRAAGYAPREADHQWRDLSLAFARTYPQRMATLLGRKALALFQSYNFHDNAFAIQFSDRLAHWPLLPTFWLLPLGLAGLLLGLRRLWPFALMVAAQIAVCLLFYTSVRFRLPILPAAALGIPVLLQTRSHLGQVLSWQRLVLFAFLLAVIASLLVPRLPAAYEAQATQLEQDANHAYQKADIPLREQRFRAASQAIAEVLYVAPWLAQKLPVPGLPLDLKQMAADLVPRARTESAARQSDVWRWFRLGQLSGLAGDWQGAILAYEGLAQHAHLPVDERLLYQALVGQGIARQRLGDQAAARLTFRKATQLVPGAVEALVGLANLGDAAALAQAEHVNPRFEVRYQQGRMALDAGAAAQAVAPLAELLRDVPGYARARMLYAVALFGAGQLDQAVAAGERAQRQVPGLLDATYRLTPLMEAAARRSNRPNDWQRMAEFAEHDGDLDAALRAWSELDRMAPLKAEDLARVGWILLRHEETALARSWFERALKTQPDQPHAKAGLQLARQRP